MDLSVSGNVWVVVLIMLVSLVACGKHGADLKSHAGNEEKRIDMLTLEKRHSGYAGNPRQWHEFITCWQNSMSQQFNRKKKIDPEAVNLSVVAGNDVTKNDANRRSAAAILMDIEKLENNLQVTLPQSYKDFLEAYQPARLEPRMAPWGKLLIGFFSSSQVERLVTAAPKTLQILEENAINSDDESYFVYGVKQDDVARRTRYLRNAILVGMHGEARHDLIVLYPDAKTMDGEMEAALLFHSGEYRAPSFAELIRQLSVVEIRDVDGEGLPYSQEMLKGTCADKLAINNICWE